MLPPKITTSSPTLQMSTQQLLGWKTRAQQGKSVTPEHKKPGVPAAHRWPYNRRSARARTQQHPVNNATASGQVPETGSADTTPISSKLQSRSLVRVAFYLKK